MSSTITATPDEGPEGYGFRTDATAVVGDTATTVSTVVTDTGVTVSYDVDSAEAAEAALLANEVRSFISRFWVAPTTASLDLIVLWIIGTHLRGRDATPFLMEAWPLLMLGSTGPASGKSTALKLVAELSCRGELVVDPTAPSLLNLVDELRSTSCIDEYDTMLGKGAGSRNMRSHLLNSYTAGGNITRAASGGVRKVDVHYPIALAGMLGTWNTHTALNALRTRTLVIHCKPKTQGPDVPDVETYRRRHSTHAKVLNEVLGAWGLAHGPAIAQRAEYIELPADIVNRDAELWEPIMAVAEALGGDWPDRARAACLEITSGTPGEDDAPKTPVEWLLRDLAHVVGQTPRMSSADMVTGLLALPDSPWRHWLSADPSSPAVSGGKHMAALLAERNGVNGKPLKPTVLKIDGEVYRGFKRADLVAAGMPDLPVAPAEDAPAEDDAPAAPKRPARRRNPAPKRAPGGPAEPLNGDALS